MLLDRIVNYSHRTQFYSSAGVFVADSKNNAYFEGIRAGLEDMVESLESGRKLTRREIRLPETPPEISGKQIADLRTKRLQMSQNVFASVLNVSLRTVQAWEQGRNAPCGPALRLLWLLLARPDMVQSILTAPEVAKLTR